jgi:hypothetical protein
MSNAAFVLIAVGLSVVVSAIIWFFSRKPQTFMSSIDDFEREMRALGGEAPGHRHGRRRPRERTDRDRARGGGHLTEPSPSTSEERLR